MPMITGAMSDTMLDRIGKIALPITMPRLVNALLSSFNCDSVVENRMDDSIASAPMVSSSSALSAACSLANSNARATTSCAPAKRANRPIRRWSVNSSTSKSAISVSALSPSPSKNACINSPF